MRSIIVTIILAISSTLVSVAAADPPADSGTAHPSTFAIDSIITTRVRAGLAAKQLSAFAAILVESDDAGVVWLRGMAPTQDAHDLAGIIAAETVGVTIVHNHIMVGDRP